VYFVAAFHGTLRCFDTKGRELCEHTLPRFVPLSVTPISATGLRHSYPPDGNSYDRVANLVAVGDRLIFQGAEEFRPEEDERPPLSYFDDTFDVLNGAWTSARHPSPFGAPFYAFDRGPRVSGGERPVLLAVALRSTAAPSVVLGHVPLTILAPS